MSEGSRAGLSILVVDDDECCLGSLEDFLAVEGHAVRTATRGHEAVQVARRCLSQNQPIELSILDVNIPDLSGLELFERLTRVVPGVGAIFISGDACASLECRVRAVGGFALVSKPLDVARMRRTLDDYRGWRLSQM